MTEPTSATFTRRVRRSVEVPYLLFSPGETEARAGLVVFLHGAGEKGDLSRLRASAVPRLLAEGLDVGGAYVACPLCPGGRAGWPIDDLATWIDHLAATLPGVGGRVSLTGISMGGRGVWEFAYDHAARLTAIAPVAAFGIPTLAPRLGRLPAWVWHGKADDVVPVAAGRAMHRAILDAGGVCRMTELPAAGHACTREVYARPELWAWLLRPDATPVPQSDR